MGAVFIFDSDLCDIVIIWKSKRKDFSRVIFENTKREKESDKPLV
jgi:hypothetical protein